MDYENLLNEITDKNIQIMEFEFQGQAKGYYHNNCIALNTKIDTVVEKKCIMAEELGHHETSLYNLVVTFDRKLFIFLTNITLLIIFNILIYYFAYAPLGNMHFIF